MRHWEVHRYTAPSRGNVVGMSMYFKWTENWFREIGFGIGKRFIYWQFHRRSNET
mgnify:CR=1 FL=1